jgi:hypothetical protein
MNDDGSPATSTNARLRVEPGFARREPKNVVAEATGEGGGSRGDHGFIRATRRVNEPRAAVVEVGRDGAPRAVNRQGVALVREEWRVVDRWWTEEPVHRRYFEVVLDGGQSTVVFRDEERGGWFSQRGA